MYQAILIQMSKSIRESVEDILEEHDDILNRHTDLVESVEELLEEVEEQETFIASQEEYINHLLSPQRYVELVVVILMAYLYGAWFGVYMCPK